MTEADLENAIVKWVEEHNGLCLKLVLLNLVGWPDRTIILPGGKILFVETKKSKSANRRRMQEVWLKKIRERGFVADFCWTFERFLGLVVEAGFSI